MKVFVSFVTFLVFITCALQVVYGEIRPAEVTNKAPFEIHRIVVIGDVHGDPGNFKQILAMSDLIEYTNPDNNDVVWNPKWELKEMEHSKEHHTLLRTTLIQMGDLIDRGEDDLGVLEMATVLFDQVKQNHTHDNVVLLLGNHELLNLQGMFHYVHPETMGGFLSKALRKRSFAADGNFGRFLLENCTVVHLEADTIFVHAGLNEQFASKGIDFLNKETLKAIVEKNYRHPLLGTSGPLWTRQMIMEASNNKCTGVQKMLETIGAKRIVVGHTPQRSGHVETFCDDAVIAVDVGLSRWMYGNLAALELTVTSFRSSSGKVHQDIVMREITTSGMQKTKTLEESLNDSLLLEELQHAAEEYQQAHKTSLNRDDL